MRARSCRPQTLLGRARRRCGCQDELCDGNGPRASSLLFPQPDEIREDAPLRCCATSPSTRPLLKSAASTGVPLSWRPSWGSCPLAARPLKHGGPFAVRCLAPPCPAFALFCPALPCLDIAPLPSVPRGPMTHTRRPAGGGAALRSGGRHLAGALGAALPHCFAPRPLPGPFAATGGPSHGGLRGPPDGPRRLPESRVLPQCSVYHG